MGYTHYWYRQRDIPEEKFSRILDDFDKLQTVLGAMGVKLAGGNGEGFPELTHEIICFNGLAKCGHEREDFGIAWPSTTARFVKNGGGQVLEGSWFAGATLNRRACGGDCSHETFYFPRSIPKRDFEQFDSKRKDLMFDCTKTAFKPYDLAVNACLIIAKHYLGENILVSSDGELCQWVDAVFLCQKFLGYGEDFKLDR